MAISKKTIQAGNVGNEVWIGRFAPYYDTAVEVLNGKQVYVLRFSLKEAEIAIEMLQAEIDRITGRKEQVSDE